MRVLDDQRDDRTVLSWLDDGKAFEIRNVRELESDILPEAFDFDPSFRLFQRKVRVRVLTVRLSSLFSNLLRWWQGPISQLSVFYLCACAIIVEPIRFCKGTEQWSRCFLILARGKTVNVAYLLIIDSFILLWTYWSPLTPNTLNLSQKFVKGNLDLCKKISPVRNVSSRASSTQAEDDMIESAIQVLCFIFPAFKVFIQMFSEVTHIQVPLWPIATSHLFMCVMYYLVVVKKKKVPVLKRLLRILSSSSSMRQIRNAN